MQHKLNLVKIYENTQTINYLLIDLFQYKYYNWQAYNFTDLVGLPTNWNIIYIIFVDCSSHCIFLVIFFSFLLLLFF